MAAVSANKLELLQIADAVAREKSIDRGIVIAAMEDAIARIQGTAAVVAQRVGLMMRIGGAEPHEKDGVLVTFAIAIGVFAEIQIGPRSAV